MLLYCIMLLHCAGLTLRSVILFILLQLGFGPVAVVQHRHHRHVIHIPLFAVYVPRRFIFTCLLAEVKKMWI
jgi:hypothetical protein